MSSRPDDRILLIGLPGAGKTTVGKALARRLGRAFVDLDAVVVADAGRSIPAIFAAEGERAFRDREERLLKRLVLEASPATVIACGGGIVSRKANRRQLASAGVVVWLDVTIAVAGRRIRSARPGSRPLASILTSRPRQLERRLRWYAALGRRVAADACPAEVVESVLRVLPPSIASRGRS